MQQVKMSFDLPVAMRRQLDVAAASLGLSASELVRRAVAEVLDQAREANRALAVYFDIADAEQVTRERVSA